MQLVLLKMCVCLFNWTIQCCSAIQCVTLSAPSTMSHKYDFRSKPSFEILFILWVPFFLNRWSVWGKVGLSMAHKTTNYFYLHGISCTFYQHNWKSTSSRTFYLITHFSGFPSDYKIMLISLNLEGKKMSQTCAPSLAVSCILHPFIVKDSLYILSLLIHSLSHILLILMNIIL